MIKKRNTISALLITVMMTSIFSLPIINNDNSVQAATKKVKVTYNANGGKFTAKKYAKKKSYSKKVNKGKKIGTLPRINRIGYTFKGWYTKKSGGKKLSRKTRTKKDTKLYAKWAAKSYAVKFDANGGTVKTSSKKVKYNSKYGTLPTPTGSTAFLGWYTSPTGGKKIKNKTKVSITKNVTLYARWANLTINKDLYKLIGMSEDKFKETPECKSSIIIGTGYKNDLIDCVIVLGKNIIKEDFRAMTAAEFTKKTNKHWKTVYDVSKNEDIFEYTIHEVKDGNYYVWFIAIDDIVDGNSNFFISLEPFTPAGI